MEPSDFLRRVVEALELLDLRYLVTGSTATSYHGEPRFTNDADVVVDLSEGDVAALLTRFPAPEFYADLEAARAAVRGRGQFNIIHPRSGLKADIMVARMDAFDHSRFARARRVDVGGLQLTMSAAEDAIVKKLVFYREGGSEKHLRDIASVLKVSGEAVDRAYVAEWAQRFGVLDVWERVLDQVRNPSHPV